MAVVKMIIIVFMFGLIACKETKHKYRRPSVLCLNCERPQIYGGGYYGIGYLLHLQFTEPMKEDALRHIGVYKIIGDTKDGVTPLGRDVVEWVAWVTSHTEDNPVAAVKIPEYVVKYFLEPLSAVFHASEEFARSYIENLIKKFEESVTIHFPPELTSESFLEDGEVIVEEYPLKEYSQYANLHEGDTVVIYDSYGPRLTAQIIECKHYIIQCKSYTQTECGSIKTVTLRPEPPIKTGVIYKALDDFMLVVKKEAKSINGLRIDGDRFSDLNDGLDNNSDFYFLFDNNGIYNVDIKRPRLVHVESVTRSQIFWYRDDMDLRCCIKEDGCPHFQGKLNPPPEFLPLILPSAKVIFDEKIDPISLAKNAKVYTLDGYPVEGTWYVVKKIAERVPVAYGWWDICMELYQPPYGLYYNLFEFPASEGLARYIEENWDSPLAEEFANCFARGGIFCDLKDKYPVPKFYGCIKRYVDDVDRILCKPLWGYIGAFFKCNEGYILCGDIRYVSEGDLLIWLAEMSQWSCTSKEVIRPYISREMREDKLWANYPYNNLLRVWQIEEVYETFCNGDRTGQIKLDRIIPEEEGIGEVYKVQKAEDADIPSHEFYFVPIRDPNMEYVMPGTIQVETVRPWYPAFVSAPTIVMKKLPVLTIVLGDGIKDIAGNTFYDGDEEDEDNVLIVHVYFQ